jgi:hypothetical protein
VINFKKGYNKIMEDYPKEQLWTLYESLPDDLKDAIFSEKTAEAIYSICQRYGLEKETDKIAKYTGYVLLGLLSPEDFQKELQDNLKLNQYSAKKIALEINRFVFFPVKESLEALYKIKPILPEEKVQPYQKRGKDPYREPIE